MAEGQLLLVPEVEVATYWTSLEDPAEVVLPWYPNAVINKFPILDDSSHLVTATLVLPRVDGWSTHSLSGRCGAVLYYPTSAGYMLRSPVSSGPEPLFWRAGGAPALWRQ